jgi:two-component system, NarL family, sensor histidine kinase NreB
MLSRQRQSAIARGYNCPVLPDVPGVSGRYGESMESTLQAPGPMEPSTAQVLFGAMERERAAVADMLRSDTAQVLATALLGLTAVAEAGDPTQALEVIDGLRSELRAAVARVQVLATLVKPSVLDDFGLSAALRALGECTAEGSGVRVEVQGHVDARLLGARTEALVYRILEEAVRNAVRHAGTSRVLVSISQEPDELLFEVSDDGCGFDAWDAQQSPNDRSGLLLMHGRARALSGFLELESAQNAGTRVSLRLPLKGTVS